MIKATTNRPRLEYCILDWETYPAESVRFNNLDTLQTWLAEHTSSEELRKDKGYMKHFAHLVFSEPGLRDMQINVSFAISDKEGGFNPFSGHIRDFILDAVRQQEPHAFYTHYAPALMPDADVSHQYEEEERAELGM